jgi:hypothetical protein
MKPSRFIHYRKFLLQKNCSNHMAIILETYGFLIKYNWRGGFTCGYQLYIFQHKAMKQPPLCSPATYKTLTNISLIQVERTTTIQTVPTLVNALFIDLMCHQKIVLMFLGDLWSSSVNVNKRRMITAFLSFFRSWEGMGLHFFYFWKYVSSLDSQQIALFEVSDVRHIWNFFCQGLPSWNTLEKGFM